MKLRTKYHYFKGYSRAKEFADELNSRARVHYWVVKSNGEGYTVYNLRKDGLMKTREQVEMLKRNWMNDPCWDIYETEDYQEYRDELRVFQLNMTQEWRAIEYNKVYSFAQGLGIETIGNAGDEPDLSLARYLIKLETRIKELEQQHP